MPSLLSKIFTGARHEDPANIGGKFSLTGDVAIEAAAAGGDGPKLATFDVMAYTGAPMRLNGYRFPVILDLHGVKVAGDQIPALHAHDDDRVVGHTTEAIINAEGVRFKGVISGVGAHANEVTANAKNGFRWQASVGAPAPDPKSVEHLQAGKSTTVNGRTVAGPMTIVRATTLTEFSFVARGADGATNAAIAAERATMPTEIESPDAIRAERDRVGAIYAFAVNAGNPAAAMKIAAEAVAEGWSEEKAELEMIRASRPKPIFFEGSPAIHSRASDHGLEVFQAKLLLDGGLEDLAAKVFGDRVIEAARRMPFSGEAETMRALEATGVSQSNLSVALSNTASLVLESTYKEARASWRSFCAIKPVDNFHAATSVRPSADFSLDQIGVTGELQHGVLGESTYSYRADTFGKIFTVDRRQKMNDSTNLYGEVLVELAKAAARAVSDNAIRTLLGAGDPFFHTSLNNKTTDVFNVTALGAMIARMWKQRDPQGNDLDMTPRTLLVTPELEGAAKAALESEYIQRLATDQGPSGNPLRGSLKLEVDSRLSNPKFAGASPTLWFLFAAPSESPMAMAFLRGKQTPTLETFGFDHDPKTLAMTWRVYHDFGSALGEYRAAQKSTGAGS